MGRDMTWHDVLRYITWHDGEGYDELGYDMSWCDEMYHNMTWWSEIWHIMTRWDGYDMIRYDGIYHNMTCVTMICHNMAYEYYGPPTHANPCNPKPQLAGNGCGPPVLGDSLPRKELVELVFFKLGITAFMPQPLRCKGKTWVSRARASHSKAYIMTWHEVGWWSTSDMTYRYMSNILT